jgi:superfamily II DNA or RNA helicase
MYDFPEKNLFNWQRDCLQKWFDNGCRGIVNVVTGAGKTVLALAAAQYLRADISRATEKLKVKIVVPKIFLAAQWQKAIMGELHIPRGKIGIYRNSHDASKEFMIYVVNSARYSISRHILADMKAGSSVLLICDECHHYGSGENSKIFDFLPHIGDSRYYSLGLSATPRSQNYKNVLVPALGREIYKYGFGSAVNENVISGYSIFNIAVHFDCDELDEYSKLSVQISKNIAWLKRNKPSLNSLSGAGFFHALQEMTSDTGQSAQAARTALALMYNRKKIVYSAKARLACAIDIVASLPVTERVIVFAEQIEIVETLYKKLGALYPRRTARYHSAMSAAARANALNAYRDFEVRLLICCRALDEGFDVPETDAGIILSSTGSVRQRVQRIGRILRRCGKGGTKNVYYLYVCESSEEDGLVTAEVYRDVPVLDLTFDCADGFWCDAFEETFARVLDGAAQKGASAEILNELYRNLKRMLIRGDTRCSRQQCLENIERAPSVAERNYWIAVFQASS